MSTVLITGCSTGFGFIIAHELVAAGHEVVATMRALEGRNADNAARLRAAGEGGPGTLHIVELDVTSDASVEAAFAQASERVGELDVVVNNAGYGTSGLLETVSVEQMRDLFEVNVFGGHRVNRAALPAMRARKQGLIIHVSSTIARILFPYFGAYGPSKWALEAMAETYHHELGPLGIDVCIVQPGGYKTEFMANMQQPADAPRVASYGELAETAANFWAGSAESLAAEGAPGPELIAEGILELMQMEPGQRPLRKVIDPMLGQAVETINDTISAVQNQVFEAMAKQGQ